MKATRGQIAKMWCMAKQLKMDGDILHDFVFSVTGERHISQLSSTQAGRVLMEMSRYFEQSHKITGAQKSKIFKLMYLLGWQPVQLRGFVKKMTGIEIINWLNREQAYKVIEGLKKIWERQNEHGEGA